MKKLTISPRLLPRFWRLNLGSGNISPFGFQTWGGGWAGGRMARDGEKWKWRSLTEKVGWLLPQERFWTLSTRSLWHDRCSPSRGDLISWQSKALSLVSHSVQWFGPLSGNKKRVARAVPSDNIFHIFFQWKKSCFTKLCEFQVYIRVTFQIVLHYRFLQEMEYSSLCYMQVFVVYFA